MTLSRRALDRLTKDFFGRSARVDVRRIEHVQAGIETDVDEARRSSDIGVAPRLEELIRAAEGSGSQTESRHTES